MPVTEQLNHQTVQVRVISDEKNELNDTLGEHNDAWWNALTDCRAPTRNFCASTRRLD